IHRLNHDACSSSRKIRLLGQAPRLKVHILRKTTELHKAAATEGIHRARRADLEDRGPERMIRTYPALMHSIKTIDFTKWKKRIARNQLEELNSGIQNGYRSSPWL
ncbi:hypothetical protein, partial [Bradyrhizobium sp. sBnM-33]|uniref:hypothetical protein n=1 Tax=Bradyrhizobium sp. sBnM-33 TaxID=2831780 RepID=UPI001BD0FA80